MEIKDYPWFFDLKRRLGKRREARCEKPVLCFQVYQHTSSLKPIPDIEKHITMYVFDSE